MTTIIKTSGEQVPFDSNRLHQSLKRVGADESLIKEIVDEVSRSVVDRMSTHTIYRMAFHLLRKKSRTIAAKYHLKRAIMQLGLSGYPFEKYVAEILQHQGFQTQNNQIVHGFCVSHEVDIVAERSDQKIFIECKYHNRLGIKCDVKISLYFKARFQDIELSYKKKAGEKVKGWLVTNTQFTQDAIQYGLCVGLHLVGWDFPAKGSLKELIEFSGLYPITCITSFTKAEISQLLEKNITICKTISNNIHLLDELDIPKSRRDSIIEQCHSLGSNAAN
ncbi:MAG: restriction endonuclease [Legionella sp.]|nr:restriction endonuclease [Legionella sp.]